MHVSNTLFHEPTPQSSAYLGMVNMDPSRLAGLPAELTALEHGAPASEYVLAWEGLKEIRAAGAPTMRSAVDIARALEHLPTAREIITPHLNIILGDMSRGRNIGPGTLGLVLDIAQVKSSSRGIIDPNTPEGRGYQTGARKALNSFILGIHPNLRADNKDANKALNDPKFTCAIGETEFVRYAGQSAPEAITKLRAERVARALLDIRAAHVKHLPSSAVGIGRWAISQPGIKESLRRKLIERLPGVR